MSAVTHFPHRSGRAVTAPKSPAFLRRLLRSISRRLANRAAIRQLAQADDQMLHDIGLTRSDVDAALRTPPLADPIERVRAFSADWRGAA
jgi:uncharacterized protein YjiS (DUF1127 family)